MSDAGRVKEIAGAREIYETTLTIPHPYEDGMAEKWISSLAHQFYSDTGVDLAIVERSTGSVIGSIGLAADRRHDRAALGFFIGFSYWGNGYCTEAAVVMIQYGFGVLKYHKITSGHMECNRASGRVMEKAGMQKEGTLIDHVMKDGKFHTLIVYGTINSESGGRGHLDPDPHASLRAGPHGTGREDAAERPVG
jgi:[ribosomal protein S5]-alanine N-acetyltransferase